MLDLGNWLRSGARASFPMSVCMRLVLMHCKEKRDTWTQTDAGLLFFVTVSQSCVLNPQKIRYYSHFCFIQVSKCKEYVYTHIYKHTYILTDMFLFIITKQGYRCCLLFISVFGYSGPVPFHQLYTIHHSEYRSVFAFSSLPPKPYVFR